jgi:hypothetical protein
MEKAILAGGSLRDIAGRFKVSKSALERHCKEHLPKRVVRSAEKHELADGRTLLEQLRELGADTRAILTEAREAGGDSALALKAIARLERQLELQGRLLGELKDGGPVVNVLVSPEWVTLRTVILGALSRHPEAQRDVAGAIREAGALNDRPEY